MIEDLNKGIDLITYNHLNLPTHIYFANNGTAGRRIGYVYTADGIKLRKYTHLNTNAEGPVSDYVGAFVYENNELQFIQTSEGRLVPDDNGGYNYEYALKDHLGNTRVMFSQTGEVLQDQSYYPFGMSMGEALTFDMPSTLPDNKYLYNGKELQNDFGLGWYDYGAMFYDPTLGRWHAVDPMAEAYNRESPYTYVKNNPLIFVDPDGNWARNSMFNDPFYDFPDEYYEDSSTGNPNSNDPDKNPNAKPPDLPKIDFISWFNSFIEAIFTNGDNDDIPEDLKAELPFEGKSARIIREPDMISITVNGKLFFITGAAVEAGLVYVKDDGFGVVITFKGGAGADVSIGGNFSAGWYTGNDKPTIESLNGASLYIDGCGNIFSAGIAGDWDPDTKIIGRPWTIVSAGGSLGSNTITITPMGSAGASATIATPIRLPNKKE
jgi:RHS repeat-associated protein